MWFSFCGDSSPYTYLFFILYKRISAQTYIFNLQIKKSWKMWCFWDDETVVWELCSLKRYKCTYMYLTSSTQILKGVLLILSDIYVRDWSPTGRFEVWWILKSALYCKRRVKSCTGDHGGHYYGLLFYDTICRWLPVCFSRTHCIHLLLEYGGSMFIRNIGNHIHGLSLEDQRMNLHHCGSIKLYMKYHTFIILKCNCTHIRYSFIKKKINLITCNCVHHDVENFQF
jgi:hypothetical protein